MMPSNDPATAKRSQSPRFHWDIHLKRDTYNGLVLSWIADHLVDWKDQSLSAILSFWGPFALRDLEQQGTASRFNPSSRSEAILCVQRLQRQVYLLCEAFDLPLQSSDVTLSSVSLSPAPSVVSLPSESSLPLTTAADVLLESEIIGSVRISGFDDDLALLED